MTYETALYFGYGSNLNSADWARACETNGIDPSELERLYPAYLPDVTLRFHFHSGSRRGGVLGIEDGVGCVVSGYIFRASDRAWKLLDKKEGHPNAYYRTTMVAMTETGDQVDVETYRVNPALQRRFVKPSKEYLEICLAGRIELGLETESLLDASNDVVHQPLDALFTYGTLMRGESRFAIVARHGVECALLSETRGVLTIAGQYPGMLPHPDYDVQGDFLRIKDIASLLSELDVIEGFAGFDSPSNLFRRAICKVHVGDGWERLAWVYLACDDKLPRSPTPDWRFEQDRFAAFRDAVVKAHADANPVFFECLSRNYSHFSVKPQSELPIFDHASTRDALDVGQISERELAQASGIWTALC